MQEAQAFERQGPTQSDQVPRASILNTVGLAHVTLQRGWNERVGPRVGNVTLTEVLNG